MGLASGLIALALLVSPVLTLVPPNQHVIGVEPTSNLKSGEKIRQKLHKAEIIPTVIDDFIPSLTLDVKWSTDNYASLGNTLKPKKLQDAPSISLHASSSGKSAICSETTRSFVITLTDPDAPSRDDPKWSEMCHWIATGASFSSSDCSTLDLDEVMPYKAPGPPEKTGKHRYVFFAFTPQNGTTDKLYPSKPKDRQHWGYDGPDDNGKTHGVRDWAKENGLVPVAANFIYSKHKKQ
ncbi:phosphatidylethanolamine-binding protein [Apodospora peruviana]|uniref:Phosphatidylethanolamine-binding protein n=1 Tax=Apodospora peruviana TaxID=516989 RepID=A0AAE0MBW3_9PEZI|nr:phosphatidylethanolamine-binding protein [Apodospora peruviana]